MKQSQSKLSQSDAKLYLNLMWSLQFYVSQKYSIASDLENFLAYAKADFDIRKEARDTLFANRDIIPEYADKNPDGFCEDHLSIVRSWENFINGPFIVERLTKKYAVFINDDHVFGVLCLRDDWKEVIRSAYKLPFHAETTILPFKDKIIYDGILTLTGARISTDLALRFEDTYLDAKYDKRIITSFNPAVCAEAAFLKTEKPALEAVA